MIRNISKDKVLINRIKFANSILENIFGLMFKSSINYGLVFNFNIENKHHIHTYFMKFPIDVLFVDSKFNVSKIYHNVKPWRFDVFGRGKYVIELPAGKSLNTQVGDKISFK